MFDSELENLVGILVVVTATVIYLYMTIRIAGEYERFAVTTLGRFSGLKGPGLLFRWLGGESTWTRIAIGDSGELMGPDVGRFDGLDLPVRYDGSLRLGTAVKITGFTETEIKVEADPSKSRAIKCDKCGQEIRI